MTNIIISNILKSFICVGFHCSSLYLPPILDFQWFSWILVSVSIVKETWGKDTQNIEYFSEKEDPAIPTINLGIPNTERGRFSKQLSIFFVYRKIMVHVFVGHSFLCTSKHAFDVPLWIERCEVNGISSTFSGHCGKTMAMLRRWLKEKKFEKVSWFLIADDDTIIKYTQFKWCFREYEIFLSCGNHVVWKMCDMVWKSFKC